MLARSNDMVRECILCMFIKSYAGKLNTSHALAWMARRPKKHEEKYRHTERKRAYLSINRLFTVYHTTVRCIRTVLAIAKRVRLDKMRLLRRTQFKCLRAAHTHTLYWAHCSVWVATKTTRQICRYISEHVFIENLISKITENCFHSECVYIAIESHTTNDTYASS